MSKGITVGDCVSLLDEVGIDEEMLDKIIIEHEDFVEGTIGHKVHVWLVEFKNRGNLMRVAGRASVIGEVVFYGILRDEMDRFMKDYIIAHKEMSK